MNAHIPLRIAAGVAAATLLIALNVAALIFGWNAPAIVTAAIVTDLGAIALAFWLAWRNSLAAEADFERLARAQRAQTDAVKAVLADTEDRFSAILESAMDAIITVNESQTVVVFNAAAENVFGWTRNEAIGGPLTRFLPERFRHDHHRHLESFGLTGVTNRRMGDSTVLWALRADGTEFPIEASISQTGVDGRRLFTVILRDVTHRKAAEDALHQSQIELRELSAALLQAREDEKTSIARELHDELGQQLTALKMDLAWTRERLPAGRTDLADKLARMDATLDSTVNATRRISADLRPLMLDDLGLGDAAEWLVEDFAQRSGIACELDLDDAEDVSEFTPLVATALYRALQESLTNVARHAAATRVHVKLGFEAGEAVLSVEDDGRGIDDEDRRKPRSFGLKGLRERAHYLGGTAAVESSQDGGTRVRVCIPTPKAEAA